ncbi:MATE family efflux transporter [Paenibacillus lentus]|uniref:Probable multidrug resistance protein NorM n=1 Tax=Paenibacillus lentus TaxID=1338368 RepID=A0A3Q8S5K4_9BACL|nr:MATE family efflux transporter [Paenibacillus lentus]AZK47491.1 MATE family efflux transporter [Paenibacillus lentus]
MKGMLNLTDGPITPVLMKLSLPIIATNFISTTYGLVDMIWVGKLGSGPVAAIGTANFYVNLAVAISTMITIGTGVKVAHSIGEKQSDRAKTYIKNGFLITALVGIVYMLFIIMTKDKLIGYFELADAEIERMATQFLVISIIGNLFNLFNLLFSTIMNSLGDSKRPFRIFTVGFLLNMILDPLLIFGYGSFEGLGVSGAALATLSANIILTLLFIYKTKNNEFFSKYTKIDKASMKEVLKLGLPISVQRVTFTVISIVIAKIIVSWGPDAIAVQRVGIQIESISYMTIGGLQGAVAAFFGQNFGARKIVRIKDGYRISLLLTTVFGMFTSLMFVVFPKEIFSLFLNDPSSLMLGVDYMKIIGYSQAFMCMELMTVGAFNGLGKTYIPPIFSIILTGLRIPLAILLSGPFGLNGVWLSIAITSVLKGIILVGWFKGILNKMSSKLLNQAV